MRVIRSPPGSQLERNRQFESVWDRWLRLSTFRRHSAEHRDATGIDWRKANGTKGHPVWASVPIATDPNKYDLSVLLALNLALNPTNFKLS